MRKLSAVFTILLLGLCLNAAADTVTLKDGSVVEGTIIQQDENQVTVTIKESEAISSDRIIKAADIAKIEKTSKDDIDFGQIKDLKPDPWRTLTPEEYTATIAKLNNFLTTYPDSAHKAAVQAMIAAFQDEQAHQQAGDVKLYGQWISSQDATARDTDVQAQTIYLRMEDSRTRGDVVGALNNFDKLEKGSPTSRAYAIAIPEAEALVDTLAGQVNGAGGALKVKEDRFKQSVAITPEPDKSIMVAARQNELARYDAAMDAALKSGSKWPPLIADSQKSLEALTTLIATEKERLLALPLEKMTNSLAATDKAAAFIAAGNFAAADAPLRTAFSLWPANAQINVLKNDIAASKTAPPHPGTPAPVAVASRTPVPRVVTAASATPAPSARPRASSAATAASTNDEGEKSAGPTSAWDSFLNFIFTIQGAVLIVVCAIGLFVATSFLQRSKKNRISEER